MNKLKLALVMPFSFLFFACQPNSADKAALETQNSHNQSDIIKHDNQLLNHQQIKSDFAAHWLSENLIVIAKDSPIISSSNPVQLRLATQTEKQESIALTASKMPAWVEEKHPHLASFSAFSIKLKAETAKQWLKQPLFVYNVKSITPANSTGGKQPNHISYLQYSSLIDQLYTKGNKDANEVDDLGASIKTDHISLKLWAPTAKQVRVKLFNQDKTPATPAELVMIEDSSTGVWHTQTSSTLSGSYYQYQLEVFHPTTQSYQNITTTDPYSLSLSANSEYSQIVDLDAANTQPINWQNQTVPVVGKPEDAIFYEVHIRDFSAADTALANEQNRGKYSAFSEQSSHGIEHLKKLKAAGLTHIHLLPAFDIGTVNEIANQTIQLSSTKSEVCAIAPAASICEKPIGDSVTLEQILTGFDPITSEAQALVTELKTRDNYNWGYDPFHYTVPEGSYAVNPEGKARIIEFRQMVQSIHNLGFRVIMDVVYNHTHQARLEPTSVLDKIVPNYYQRLHPITGAIEQSTCCDNTATERVMMEKLMIDSLVVWARDYKIDGFRFDLMAHQPKSAMLKAREAVWAVDPDNYFYGEGWNFGEVANNSQFVQASQLELGGSEIGTFTDRLRDAVRGPGISVSGDDIRRNQGIGNGLQTVPNELNTTTSANTPDHQLLMDQLRIGLAGNLADFPIEDHNGKQVTGKDIPYGSQPTGYAKDPADTINYVSKHDNQTLWDNNQYRNANHLTTEQRVRLHNQSLSYVLMAQGIPFIHMGSELLRSKSYLRDSYDYSDWFNRVDFSKQNNFYNVGLPPAEKDQVNWSLIKKLLADNQGKDLPSPQNIAFASKVFNEFLTIRTTSPLFSLATAEEIITQVEFLNTGKNQQTGLIVMQISDKGELDASYQQIMILFNASSEAIGFSHANADEFALHPIQKNSVDTVVKTSKAQHGKLTVPAFTTAVFIR